MKGEGNQQDYGMRVYDPRLGRFLSMDPITKEYPELTPYQFASNTPIEAIDLDGLEKLTIKYKIHNGEENIISVTTDYSLKYFLMSIGVLPIKPKVAQFIRVNDNGKVVDKTSDIPLKNFGSTLYVGPFNPTYKDGPQKGGDSYDFPAINLLDKAAKKHDKAYDKAQAIGLKGALLELAVLEADKNLVNDAQEVIDIYNNNEKDPVNKQYVSAETLNAAENVVKLFQKVVIEKEVRIFGKKVIAEVKEESKTIKQTIKAVFNIPTPAI